MVFTLLENALNLCIFTHASVPLKTLGKFYENLFCQDEVVGENYDLLYQNSIRKNEMT